MVYSITNSRKRLTYSPPPVRVKASVRDAEVVRDAPAIWEPIPDSPQLMAYLSDADELFFGGAAGGGKSDLLLGLSGRKHRRSVIFRREFPLVRGIIERSREIYNARGDDHAKDSLNEQLHLWRLVGDRQVEFGSCQYEQHKEKQRGRARDFYGFDEITEFTESMYRFIIAWNRSTHIDPITKTPQRCRVVATGNPPTTSDGEWVINYWGPWLQEDHPMYPTPPGELRWVARIKDEDVWFMPEAVFRDERGKACIEYEGHRYRCRSRTFIPAKLDDNPYLRDTEYGAIIDSLPEPLRSQMRDGLFNAAREADPWQVIPTEWVKAAMKRWRDAEQPEGVPLTGLATDVARGGKDKTVISKRYGEWFAPLEKYPGITTTSGQAVSGLVIQALGDSDVTPNVDVIGIGASTVDALRAADQSVNPVNVGEATSMRDRSGKLGFINLRAALYWRMREALDPVHGDNLMLPDDRELLADLCSAKWEVKAGGRIKVESKDEIKARIGRSPDCGDAVLLNLAPNSVGVFL